jgi:hypothetical protein
MTTSLVYTHVISTIKDFTSCKNVTEESLLHIPYKDTLLSPIHYIYET